MKYYADKLKSSIGWVTVAVDEGGSVVWLYVSAPESPAQGPKQLESKFKPVEWDSKRCSHVTRQVKEYFMHKRESFDLDYKLHGTPFQVEVWNALTHIPYGKVISYGDVAKYINNPKAAIAVGQANKNNPIMLVVPCHRVIGSDGRIKGSGKGASIRELLLIHEGVEL
ncbi:MAG: methylated-DNA--[protein]-cysteine S-methyltransferase [bacterium]